MKRNSFLLGMLSMFAAMSGTNSICNTKPKETDEERKRRIAKAEIDQNKAKGLKEFYYGENSVWAINQKNADKKAQRKHWL